MQIDAFLAFWLIGTSVLAALFGILLVAAFAGPASRRSTVFGDEDGTVFLFDGESLVDASPAARVLLQHAPLRRGTAWARLLAWMQARFDDAPDALGRLPAEGAVTLAGTDAGGAPCLVTAEQRGGLTRVRITSAAEGQSGAVGTDPMTLRVMQEELANLRQCVAAAPLPIWRETTEGEVVWSNAAYLDLATAALSPGEDLSWPLPRLFGRQASAQGAPDQRQRVDRGAGGSAWFDLWSFPDAQGRLGFAVPADAAVQAEVAMRDFMQTLTKTFAHLTTGLAIFDRGRQLALFNPALMDLTGLPPDILSARPTLAAFFDAMRDRAMLPEPKDYRSWRRTMSDLERAAASGLYEETWSLPGGQTYRVTGRPHPNGALALLFEDISTEMSQTRRYRADLELGQSVVDAMDEAIAVFSPAGHLVMSNAAYAELWGEDPGATLDGAAGIADAIATWRANCAPTALWDRVEDYASALESGDGWSAEAFLADGRRLHGRFARLAGGATLAAFRVTAALPVALPRPKARRSA